MAFVLSKLKRGWHVGLMCLATLLFATVYVQREALARWPFSSYLITFTECLPIFFMGSLMAYFYKRLDDMGLCSALNNNYPRTHTLICVLNFALMIIGVRLCFLYPLERSLLHLYNSGLLWFAQMLLMLIGAPNTFTTWLADVHFLRTLGKYSFGFYLFHRVGLVLATKLDLTGRIFSTEDKLILAILIAFALGFVFYHAVEKHMIRIANHLNKRMMTRWEESGILTLT